MTSVSAMWRRLDVSDGLAHGALSELEPDADHPRGGYLLDAATLVRDAADAFSVRFSVVTDHAWQTRSTFVEVLAGDGFERVTLTADPLGAWTLDGRGWPDLGGCVDVDVASSPLTSTLPVRRLGLAVGMQSTVEAAWLDVPSLAVHRVPRTYRRLDDDPRGFARYTYTDPVYGPFELTVDRAGLVVDYQGLFERVA